uniref:Uncharacterized protein n=1 Tax=Oryza brachyantha TaxID=4533 RepID=J3LVV9_ORYBR
MHRRSGEQVSRTIVFDVLDGVKVAISFLDSALRDCLAVFYDGSSTSTLKRCAYKGGYRCNTRHIQNYVSKKINIVVDGAVF